MAKNNYKIQADQAKALFVTYDHEALVRKLGLRADETYLYTAMLGSPYRIRRSDGHISRQTPQGWVDGNSYEEVMTLLDLVCDSRMDRRLSGTWKNMRDFGLMFHRNLLENAKDPWAEVFQARSNAFIRACEALGGKPMDSGDIAYAIELFDGLQIGLQLWLGDEEFPPNLRFLWDANAAMYLRYETMYFAKGLLLRRLEEKMKDFD